MPDHAAALKAIADVWHRACSAQKTEAAVLATMGGRMDLAAKILAMPDAKMQMPEKVEIEK